MKVIGINGSPRGTRSNTAVMLDALLQGFSSYGSETRQLRLSEKSIGPCKGCYSCWTSTPGRCVQDDDMRDILADLRDVDIIVVGTPLYLNNVSGTTKTFFDRLTAAGGDPHATDAGGTARRGPRYVMVSNCGNSNRSQFDIVSLWIRRVAAMVGSEVLAEFYTASGRVLTQPGDEQKESRDGYVRFLRECGSQLAQNQRLDQEHRDRLASNVTDF